MSEKAEYENWQKEIIGLIHGWGKYQEAAKIAYEHGEVGVLFVMRIAFMDGFNDAVMEITTAAYDTKRRAEEGGES